MKKKSKYNNVITEVDGIKFRSKAEARRYGELKLLMRAGEVRFFTRQNVFGLPGGVKYLIDFIVWWEDGSHTFEDVKGFKTATYRDKKKMVEALYPVKITEIYYK